MAEVLLRTWAVFRLAAKRVLAQRWLAGATALGMACAVALVLSIPLYADAVYYRLLCEELSARYDTGVVGPIAAVQRLRQRPPFALTFRYTGALYGALDWEELAAADAYLSGSAAHELGLPRELLVRHFRSSNFRLFPSDEGAYEDTLRQLAVVNFAFVDDLADHVQLLEGRFPAVAEPLPGSAVEVMVGEPLALELGLQVGDLYQALPRQEGAEPVEPVPVRIAGVWRANNPNEDFWFYDPTALEGLFLVPEETLRDRLSPFMGHEVHLALWYIVLDGSRVHSADVPRLVQRITAVQQRASMLRPNLELDMSIVEALRKYQRAAGALTITLVAFSVPMIGLLMAFVGLVAGLSVGEQRAEIAMLRSRGATAGQVVGIAALEGLWLATVALAVGTPLGMGIARIIGRARTFLSFSINEPLRIGATTGIVAMGVAAAGFVLAVRVLPTVGAARHTIVTYRQERARQLTPPWWQRVGLDGWLLLPAGYGLYLLRKQGSITLPGVGQEGAGDPFQNPLLFLIPALGLLSLTLVLVRLLPLVVGALGWLASHTRSVGLTLACRHLARTPGFYVAPLMLLVLTLSLAAFTASAAQTLDRQLVDRTYYRVGADIQLVEQGAGQGAVGGQVGTVTAGGASSEAEPKWAFLPVSEHLRVSGVRGAARVGRYKAITRLSGGVQAGTFIGIDRTDFPQVAFWRQDFATESLGALMNALALTPNGVLVHSAFVAQHALRIGDVLRVTVDTYAQQNALDLQVVGTFDLFPTWYPGPAVATGPEGSAGAQAQQIGGPLFVGNLDYLFEEAGGEYPYEVWLATDPQADPEQIVRDVRRLRIVVTEWHSPRIGMYKEQLRPERQGLFGLLSVGFITTAVLAVLGFLFYALYSFRRRLVELGLLRAVGLSAAQMAVYLAWELALLIMTGLLVGTGLGVWVSRLVIPYLSTGTGLAGLVPPSVAQIAWAQILRVYALFGLLFIAALGSLSALLLRVRIFQAIKLGETV